MNQKEKIFKPKKKFLVLANIWFILEEGSEKNGKTSSDRSSVISKSKNKRISY